MSRAPQAREAGYAREELNCRCQKLNLISIVCTFGDDWLVEQHPAQSPMVFFDCCFELSLQER